VRALHDAIRVLCDDRALVARLGRAARALVEAEHAPDVFYTRLLAAYREVGR